MTALVADGVLKTFTGYLSPVSDAYKKVSRIAQLWHSEFSRAKPTADMSFQAGLASAEHRLRMCEIAIEVSLVLMSRVHIPIFHRLPLGSCLTLSNVSRKNTLPQPR